MLGRRPIQLRKLTIEDLDIPFKVSFRHSSAQRSATEAVLVTAETEDGARGLGEGCPRRYVTGETLESVHRFYNAHRVDFLGIRALGDLKTWIQQNTAAIDNNPAAFCAVELALIDVLAKQSGQTVEALLSLPELSGEFRYSGVLGSENLKSFRAQLQQYLHLGITDFKVKVFGDAETDQANIVAIKACGRGDIRVRIDANNLWSGPDRAINYIKDLEFPFFAIEEPLHAHDYDGCRKVFEKLGTQIILDESFTKESNLEFIQSNPNVWIINVRISKMGGVLRSLAIADKAKHIGIPIIIGAQVGETSILTRAALTVANTHRDILVAQEGAFGTYLLEHDVIDPPIMFGQGGIVASETLS